MSWFTSEEDYSIKESGFYGEPTINYGSSDPEPADSSSSSSGGWDDYQHEREYISSCIDQHTR